ncbi:hypothetical protein H0H92_014478 [Tricholoma furcatifolium]|nr:hypothetical protein H0H92_014478 [Tricholoma furcatifolium]
MAVSAASTDGASHSVQVYSDISAEWVSGDISLEVNWSTSADSDVITHQVQLETQMQYSEVNELTQYGSAYYSTPNTVSATYQTGQDVVVRAQFINNGFLPNTQDTSFRAINDDWPVFALAHDLGEINNASTPVVFSVGHVRDPALHDYDAALSRAQAMDSQINSDANTISPAYAAVVELSVRQALGATEITLAKNSDGSWNTSDILMFLRGPNSEITFWKVFSDINLLGFIPTNGAYMILHLPPLESGNMLIMALSYAQKSNDHSQLQQYTALLDQWAQYLVANSLVPNNQLSTDDFAGPLANQTNLAVKGIVGIGAMSEVYNLLGNSAQSSNYSATATSYVSQWQTFAMSTTGAHLTLDYGDSASWGLIYNLYGDKLLGLNLFPESIYTMRKSTVLPQDLVAYVFQETAWYANVAQAYGIPLDTRHTYTKSDWQLWTAAIVTDNSTRDVFINSVYSYAVNGLNSVPLSDWYDTVTGVVQGFQARPVVGGHLGVIYPYLT